MRVYCLLAAAVMAPNSMALSVIPVKLEEVMLRVSEVSKPEEVV